MIELIKLNDADIIELFVSLAVFGAEINPIPSSLFSWESSQKHTNLKVKIITFPQQR